MSGTGSEPHTGRTQTHDWTLMTNGNRNRGVIRTQEGSQKTSGYQGRGGVRFESLRRLTTRDGQGTGGLLPRL